MKLQLIRHATLRVQYADFTFLIDPMFSPQGSNPPIIHTANERRNPLVELPVSIAEISAPDAILVTHLHGDHWDEAAMATLNKEMQIFCQPGNEVAITAKTNYRRKLA
ncbi:hypothetical protein GCM10008018_10740 [Paenibacillus marchantiophytorum]|uniref:Metallo-beta-lactamase domain-containing protein n=1 Tax=Paenibacillus marchantiophytorum TaxID=1619310 RepID=A0ABQ2BQH7_9BACL|nr:MBL fold metallo-hydrolase [Paenibacillus marchantiophytorum]GGI45167.1 hypothetical protein GCM10008018_10740 [Paenibacillus marchantiophytorum]